MKKNFLRVFEINFLGAKEMKMNWKALLTLSAAVVTMSPTAYAQGFKFDGTQFQGSGCKRGTTSTVTSPDGKSLSILFDDFIVEVPQVSGDNDNDFVNELNPRKALKNDRNIDHKRCAMFINTDLPEGEIIDSIKIKLDMRGSSYIEDNAQVVFQSFLRDWRGLSRSFQNVRQGQLLTRKVWNKNNFEDEWTVSKTVTIPINTGCHERQRNKVAFVLNNALMAKLGPARPARGNGGNGFSFGRGEDFSMEGMAYSSIDSHDFGGKLDFTVITKPCGSRLNGGPQTGRVRISDNSRDLNDRNNDETRADRDARRRDAQANRGNNRCRPGLRCRP